MRVIPIAPHALLGQLEHVIDVLHAYVLARQPENETLLFYVERLRQLHKELSQALQKQRLDDQLTHSLALRNNNNG